MSLAELLKGASKNNSLTDKAGMSVFVASWRQRVNGGLALMLLLDGSHGRFQGGALVHSSA